MICRRPIVDGGIFHVDSQKTRTKPDRVTYRHAGRFSTQLCRHRDYRDMVVGGVRFTAVLICIARHAHNFEQWDGWPCLVLSSRVAACARPQPLVDLMCVKLKSLSVDEWRTEGRAAGSISAGCLVHEVLPRSFLSALPGWANMFRLLE